MPSVSLTAKHDRSWSKVLVSKEQLDILKARDTPGPGTYKPTAGPESQARVRFGSSKRKPLNDTAFRAPGPVYEHCGTQYFARTDRPSGGMKESVLSRSHFSIL